MAEKKYELCMKCGRRFVIVTPFVEIACDDTFPPKPAPCPACFGWEFKPETWWRKLWLYFFREVRD